MLEAFLLPAGVVALAEIGDKTQLLAFVLAARYRRPAPLILGILIATLLNHAVAGLLGAWLSQAVPAAALQLALGLGFLAMAIWLLVPDRLDQDAVAAPARYGAFLTTLGLFFLAEIGDKTQVATVALAARYETATLAVVLGTTAGMMLANVPAVLLGERLAGRLPARTLQRLAAALFALTGLLTLAGLARG
ncbi:MAG TPA: TMEM165/GDT1 family protein [Nevskiaceae bacterium]|nr:TMEM165/GDT1 family protein [Nevskiaceae bacterium]